MSNTVTRTDIVQHVAQSVAAGDFTDEQVDAIVDAVLAAAPLDTWSLEGLEYVSTSLDTEGFWGIVEAVTA